MRVTTYNDDGSIIEGVILAPSQVCHGVNIEKNVWHTIEALKSSVIFESKEGPYVPHEVEGILKVEGL